MDVLERAEFEVKTFGHPSKESGLNMMLEITRLRQLLSEAEKRAREARAKLQEMQRLAQIAEGSSRGVTNVLDLWEATIKFYGMQSEERR